MTNVFPLKVDNVIKYLRAWTIKSKFHGYYGNFEFNKEYRLYKLHDGSYECDVKLMTSEGWFKAPAVLTQYLVEECTTLNMLK